MKILITGGASGLGRDIAEKLLNNTENQVIITYNKSVNKAESLDKKYINCDIIKCDFTKDSDVDKLIIFIENRGLDVLINNAYHKVFDTEYFHKTVPERFELSFRLNIMPLLKITQKALLIFKKQKFGKIITVLSSSIINTPPKGWALYVAEKQYVYSLVKSWAVEYGKYNIASNAVSPGFMVTGFHQNTDYRIIEQVKNEHPLKQLLTTKEVAETVDFLVATTNQINGTNLIINAAENVI